MNGGVEIEHWMHSGSQDEQRMSCTHSNRSRGAARLASRASGIWRARCSSFRGVRNLTERKEFDRNFFRGLAAPIVGIYLSTWASLYRLVPVR